MNLHPKLTRWCQVSIPVLHAGLLIPLLDAVMASGMFWREPYFYYLVTVMLAPILIMAVMREPWVRWGVVLLVVALWIGLLVHGLPFHETVTSPFPEDH